MGLRNRPEGSHGHETKRHDARGRDRSGRGVDVGAVWNKQLLIYAQATIDTLGLDEIENIVLEEGNAGFGREAINRRKVIEQYPENQSTGNLAD